MGNYAHMGMIVCVWELGPAVRPTHKCEHKWGEMRQVCILQYLLKFSLCILPLPSSPVSADIKISACWGFAAGKKAKIVKILQPLRSAVTQERVSIYIFRGDKAGGGQGRREGGKWSPSEQLRSPQFRQVRACSLLWAPSWGWRGASGEVGRWCPQDSRPQASHRSCRAELIPCPGTTCHQADGGTLATRGLIIRSPDPAQTRRRWWWGSPSSGSAFLSSSPEGKWLRDDVKVIDEWETTRLYKLKFIPATKV